MSVVHHIYLCAVSSLGVLHRTGSVVIEGDPMIVIYNGRLRSSCKTKINQVVRKIN